MARPERNSVDYFPFLCEEGNKMFYLEETYGNDGFATFVKLLRELAKTDYHYLNLSKPSTLMYLSAKCKVSKEVLEAIINDLVDLGKFDAILWKENRIIWCQDFIESIQDAYKKRNNKCITLEGLLTLLNSLGIRKQGKLPSKASDNPQSKVKESKVKESKVDDEKEKFDNDFIDYKILFFKNKSENFDFVFEIQKIKNELDFEENEFKKIYLSQILNFLIEEKRKKVPPKKENLHQDFIDELKISSEWLNLISMQNQNLSIEKIISKLDEFEKHLKTDFKIHQTKTDFVSHFKSWLQKNIPNKQDQLLTHNR